MYQTKIFVFKLPHLHSQGHWDGPVLSTHWARLPEIRAEVALPPSLALQPSYANGYIVGLR